MIWSHQAISALKEYAALGVNSADIADKFGVSYSAIKSKCRRLGVEVKSSGRNGCRGSGEKHTRETIERIRITKLGKLGLSLEHAAAYTLARSKGFPREEAAAIARRSCP
jgi:hypothetical protein